MSLEYYKDKYEENLRIQSEQEELKYAKIKAAVLEVFPQAVYIKENIFKVDDHQLFGSEDGSLYYIFGINTGSTFASCEFKIFYHNEGELYPMLLNRQKQAEENSKYKKLGFLRKLKYDLFGC